MGKSLCHKAAIILIILLFSHLSAAVDHEADARQCDYFLETFLRTYHTLVEIQGYDKNLFELYNKSLLIDIIQSDNGNVAYVFNVVNSSTITRKWQFRTTNNSISNELYHGSMMLDGVTGTIYNFTLDGFRYPFIIQTNRMSNNPTTATSMAYEQFLIEYNHIYRNVVLETIRKKEGFDETNEWYQELIEQSILMDKRRSQGLYNKNMNLLESDNSRFNELAQECGVSNDSLAYIKSTHFPNKELFGIEYDNNWYYVIAFCLIFLGIYVLKSHLNIEEKNNKYNIYSELWDALTYPAIILFYVQNKPYDYSTPQLLTPILACILIILFYSYIREK